MKTEHALHRLSVAVIAIQGLLVLVSWVVTAAWPELPLRSLLSAEGIRWTFSSATDNLSRPCLTWMILIGMSASLSYRSGLWTGLRDIRHIDYRCRTAMAVCIGEFVLGTLILLWLTLSPHALLLGVTGHLYPSSFGHSLIPTLTLFLTVISATYGLMSKSIPSAGRVLKAMSQGIGATGPFVILYMLIAELTCSVAYVFMIGEA